MNDRSNTYTQFFLLLDGTVSRGDFWIGQVALYLLQAAAIFVIVFLMTMFQHFGLISPKSSISGHVNNLDVVFSLLIIWPVTTLILKRLRHIGRTKRYFLIVILIPILILSFTGQTAHIDFAESSIRTLSALLLGFGLIELLFVRGETQASHKLELPMKI